MYARKWIFHNFYDEAENTFSRFKLVLAGMVCPFEKINLKNTLVYYSFVVSSSSSLFTFKSSNREISVVPCY